MFRSYPDRILRDARGVPKVMLGVLFRISQESEIHSRGSTFRRQLEISRYDLNFVFQDQILDF